MSTTAADRIAGVVLPDTELVREITAFIRNTAAHPRPDFKRRILRAFNEGNKHRPHSTFGNVNADVLEHFDPSFVRDDFVDIIRNNSWPE